MSPPPRLWSAVLQLLLAWYIWEAGLAGEIYEALWRVAPMPPSQ